VDPVPRTRRLAVLPDAVQARICRIKRRDAASTNAANDVRHPAGVLPLIPTISNNLDMRSIKWFVLVVVVLWGCSAAPEEPTTKLGSETVRVEKDGKTDAFGLPLVIVIDTPPVPKEIQGPSPPIKESPKPTPKKKKSSWLPDFGL
jgi:hypothetical protein